MEKIQTILDSTLSEIRSRTDILPAWQQDEILNLIKEAIQLSYMEGRKDQKYISEGPQLISIYE